ncbi:MAG: hypothetical protein QXX57_02975 [Nitrososphaerota archaeon]
MLESIQPIATMTEPRIARSPTHYFTVTDKTNEVGESGGLG